MDVQTKVPVTLAGKDFVVKQVPMARIKRIGPLIAEAIGNVAADVSTQDGIHTVLDQLLDAPHALLSLFIDDLPKEIFHDEQNGVTLPEFESVLKKALEINRVDALKNVFSRLMPTLLQASNLTKMNSLNSALKPTAGVPQRP